MTADEILHHVWVTLHRTAHGIEVPEAGKTILSPDEFKLYGLLTKRLIASVEIASQNGNKAPFEGKG